MVLTPVLGDAATTSWPFCRSLFTRFFPTRPVPPMTTIFMSRTSSRAIGRAQVGELGEWIIPPRSLWARFRERAAPHLAYPTAPGEVLRDRSCTNRVVKTCTAEPGTRAADCPT